MRPSDVIARRRGRAPAFGQVDLGRASLSRDRDVRACSCRRVPSRAIRRARAVGRTAARGASRRRRSSPRRSPDSSVPYLFALLRGEPQRSVKPERRMRIASRLVVKLGDLSGLWIEATDQTLGVARVPDAAVGRDDDAVRSRLLVWAWEIPSPRRSRDRVGRCSYSAGRRTTPFRPRRPPGRARTRLGAAANIRERKTLVAICVGDADRRVQQTRAKTAMAIAPMR